MMLEGTASKADKLKEKAGDVDLDKIVRPVFQDEWDYVIENYTVGASDPYIIDSIGMMSYVKRPDGEEEIVAINPLGQEPAPTQPVMTVVELPEESPKTTVLPVQVSKSLTIEEKYNKRKKVFATEIPVSGDSIELRFYDNAQIDGDSISLFLNDNLIFEHIRLTEKAYMVKLPVQALNEMNELIMVAENLGSIPPNTSYMVALVGEKKYEARLESTEGSSAMIRLRKTKL